MDEQSIFIQALEIEDFRQRMAYLEQVCGDNSLLRKQVEALLEEHECSEEFLCTPAVEQMKHAADEITSVSHAASLAGQNQQEEPADPFPFLQPSEVPGSLGRIGHYDIQQLIGRGGCGIAFKAFDERLHRIVAIKVMRPEMAATSPARKRFLREARATAAIRHENVVSIYAVEESPIPFLVMEYIEGKTLQHLLNETGPLELTTVLRYGQMIANGLEAAHQKGLIHRDIKPANILVEAGIDQIRLTDFGLARAADDASQSQSGIIAGTPLYMSPEQVQGLKLDKMSDLFSLGSVLYVMCSGRPPFRARSTLAVLKRVVEEAPRPIQEIIPEVPDWLVAIIDKLHAKDPTQRFPSAQEVSRLLSQQQAEAIPLSSTAVDLSISAASSNPFSRFWPLSILLPILLLSGLGFSEATGVTQVHKTIIHLLSSEGTLAIEIHDPEVAITIDGEELTVTGTGTQEIRIKPGKHQLITTKNGEVIHQQWITVTRNGQQLVRINRDKSTKVDSLPPEIAQPEKSGWGPTSEQQLFFQRVRELPPQEQIAVVVAKLKELNPGFQAEVHPQIHQQQVTGIMFAGDLVAEIWPVRAFPELTTLRCNSNHLTHGRLKDLAPLTGMPLRILEVSNSSVTDLTPLKGMKLTELLCAHTKITDLSAIAEIPLQILNLWNCQQIQDLTPLRNMPLQELNCDYTQVVDISPLQNMRLTRLGLHATRVVDLTPLHNMPLRELYCSNTLVSDLAPLRETPLSLLHIEQTQVADLTPLTGMPLQELTMEQTLVSDFSPLETLPLKRLSLSLPLFDEQSETRLRQLQIPQIGDHVHNISAAETFWQKFSARKAEALHFAEVYSQLSAIRQHKFLLGHNPETTVVTTADEITEITLTVSPDTHDVSFLRMLKSLHRLTLTGGPKSLDLSPINNLPVAVLECSEEQALRNRQILAAMDSLTTINGHPKQNFLQSLLPPLQK